MVSQSILCFCLVDLFDVERIKDAHLAQDRTKVHRVLRDNTPSILPDKRSTLAFVSVRFAERTECCCELSDDPGIDSHRFGLRTDDRDKILQPLDIALVIELDPLVHHLEGLRLSLDGFGELARAFVEIRKSRQNDRLANLARTAGRSPDGLQKNRFRYPDDLVFDALARDDKPRSIFGEEARLT